MPDPDTMIYAPIYDSLDGYPYPATHWYYQQGDRWVAVVGEWETEDDWFADCIKDGVPLPDKKVYPINVRPPYGILSYADATGQRVEEVA